MRRPRPTNNIPILTLTTDFGLVDSYVAEMKAVLLSHCPPAQVVDVTHQIPPQDVLAASVTLERALRAFPKGTIHVVVVDPGVGTDRTLLLVEIRGQIVFCPDNGLITWPWRRLPNAARAYELAWRANSESPSHTFHGRDILAPAAAMLASGQMFIGDLAGPAIEPKLLDIAPADARATTATIIHIDHFGNATTNVPGAVLKYPDDPKAIHVAGKSIGPVQKTYADVPPGQPVALVGSSGLLEIALRNGNAAEALGLKVGQQLKIDY